MDTDTKSMQDPMAAKRKHLEEFETPAEAANDAKVFRYKKPDLTRTRAVVPLCKSDILIGAVQVIRKGGENNLHSHAAMDGFWFVLKGSARFYGPGDELRAELGPMEGIFIPRNVPYWFENAGSDDLELLQVEAFAKGMKSTRINHAPLKNGPMAEMFNPDGSELAG